MGAHNSTMVPDTLTTDEIAMISASTHYSEAEVRQLHGQVAVDCVNGFVPFSTFAAFAASMGVLDVEAASLLFRGFDADRDGIVTFAELCKGLSALTRGTNEEKLRFAFRMHDANNDGTVSRFQLTSSIRCLQKTFGDVDLEQQEFVVQETADTMLGGSPDDQLSFSDFATLAVSFPTFVRGLALVVN